MREKENVAQSKYRGRKIRERKMRHNIAGVENAGKENAAIMCCIFLSRIFHPCSFVPHFLFSHFPPLQFSAAFSFPAFSTSSILCCIFPRISTPVILCRIFFPAFSFSIFRNFSVPTERTYHARIKVIMKQLARNGASQLNYLTSNVLTLYLCISCFNVFTNVFLKNVC